MKQTTKKRVTSVLAIAMTLLLAFPLGSAHVEARTELEMDDYDDIVSTYSVDDSVLDYNDYVQNFNAVYPDKTITAGAESCVRYDEDDKETEPVIYKDYEGMSGDSLYTSENSLIEFEVDVKEEGFYNISLEYFPIKGKNSAIERSVFIDGELPYSELSMVTFYRIWEYDADSYKAANGSKAYTWEKDNQGNDCKPSMKENPEWISEYMYDSDGYITSPLSVYMTKGKHTITLLSMREPMVIHSITLSNAADKPSYAQVKSGNDANVAALGEMWQGGGKGYSDLVMVTLGTGVGGGIIIGGKIYAGMRGAGAELGHTVLVLDGEPCTCGRRGCWEAYASATALIRQTREAAVQNPQSLLAQVPAEQINGRTVFDAADRGDAAAQRVIDRYCEYIAAGMTDIVNALAPEMILLGGGVSRQGERLLAPIREYIATHCFGQREGAIPVVAAAQLGNDAGIIGAAAL